MNQLHIDESYSRQLQMNWPALYAGEDVVWRGKPLRSKYTMKDAKLTLNRHTCRRLHCFLDVDGTKDSEGRQPRRRDCVALPRIWDDLCPSSAVPLGWSLFADWLEWKNVKYAITNRRTVIRRGV